jgi:hypothetical protein
MSSNSDNRRGNSPPAWSQDPSDEDRDTVIFSSFAIRGGSIDVQLPEGETVLGRALDCGIVIDSPVVSRRHAAMVIRGDEVVLRDLGSRNGLVINGNPLRGEAKLSKGDLFSIGDIEFLLIRRQPALEAGERSSLSPPVAGDPTRPSVPPTTETSQASAFDLLRAVADKAIALGSSQEVVRLLGRHIQVTHEAVSRGRSVDEAQVLAAATYSIRVGALARDPTWIVLALEMLASRRLVPAADVVDLLYPFVRDLVPNWELVQRYRHDLDAKREELSPPDRFALKRLDGLERLIALRRS